MNIFQVIAQNLKRDPVTLRLPQRAAMPESFRGAVQLDPDKCVGCATCVYVCPANAIQVISDGDYYEWAYDPGRCTFCGRCAAVCPGLALTMAAERPFIYTQPGMLGKTHRLAYPRCPECGRPAPPLNDVVLARAFDEISDEIRALSRLCPQCRQRRCQPVLVETGYAPRNNDYER